MLSPRPSQRKCERLHALSRRLFFDIQCCAAAAALAVVRRGSGCSHDVAGKADGALPRRFEPLVSLELDECSRAVRLPRRPARARRGTPAACVCVQALCGTHERRAHLLRHVRARHARVSQVVSAPVGDSATFYRLFQLSVLAERSTHSSSCARDPCRCSPIVSISAQPEQARSGVGLAVDLQLEAGAFEFDLRLAQGCGCAHRIFFFLTHLGACRRRNARGAPFDDLRGYPNVPII